MLVPQLGIQPVLPPVELWCVNHWSASEVTEDFIFIFLLPLCNT